jgi:hypothetical protein
LLPDGSQQAIDGADTILVKLLPREGAFAGENVIGAKTGRHGHRLFEAKPEQRSTCQQDESEGDLRNDKAVAKTLSSTTHRARARFGLKRIREVAAQVEPGDGHRDDDSQCHRTEQTDQGEPSVERDMRAERQTIRAENPEQLSSPRGDQNANQSPKEGEESGFNQDLLHDMPPAGAH